MHCERRKSTSKRGFITMWNGAALRQKRMIRTVSKKVEAKIVYRQLVQEAKLISLVMSRKHFFKTHSFCKTVPIPTHRTVFDEMEMVHLRNFDWRPLTRLPMEASYIPQAPSTAVERERKKEKERLPWQAGGKSRV